MKKALIKSIMLFVITRERAFVRLFDLGNYSFRGNSSGAERKMEANKMAISTKDGGQIIDSVSSLERDEVGRSLD